MSLKRMAVVVVAGLAVAGVGACGGADKGDKSGAQAGADAGAQAGAGTGALAGTTSPEAGVGTEKGAVSGVGNAPTGSHSVEVDGRTVTGVAPGLDLPEGSKISSAFAVGDGSTVILTAPDADAVLKYYRTSGPAAGYTAINDVGGVLLLQKDTWTVNVVTNGSGSTLNFQTAG